jgi:Fur family ferric uptake transcriptional regulator
MLSRGYCEKVAIRVFRSYHRSLQGAEMKRKTVQRDAIKEVFLHEDRPMGVEEILQIGRNSVESLNQATVYRNLKLLMEDGWLKAICHPELGTFYERAEKGHHHHFHCRSCDRLFEVEGCALSDKDSAPPGFVTEGHEVFLFGLCSSCQKDDGKPGQSDETP